MLRRLKIVSDPLNFTNNPIIGNQMERIRLREQDSFKFMKHEMESAVALTDIFIDDGYRACRWASHNSQTWSLHTHADDSYRGS
mgnify:CR=1 FL=1